MNKKLPRLLRPNVRLYFLILIAFAVATFFFGEYSKILAGVQAGVILITAVYLLLSTRRRNDKLVSYLETITDSMDLTVRDTPLPVLIFNTETGDVIWTNDRFAAMTGAEETFFEANITNILPDFTWDWLLSGKHECEEPVAIGKKIYWVYGSVVLSDHEYVAMTYWTDVTDYTEMCNSYLDSRLIFVLLVLDNYDELFSGMNAKEQSLLMSDIDDKVFTWSSNKDGYLCRYDRDRYFFLFEERFLESVIKDNFSILDQVSTCKGAGGVYATLSMGIGKDGVTPQETYRFASLGLEMALSRGGNQAVLRNKYGFEFFGGKPQPTERRTKVKARVMANAFGELLSEASKVYVMGHKTADYDSIGAAIGVTCMARAKRTPVHIIVNTKAGVTQDSYLDSLKQYPQYNSVFISEQDAILGADKKTLLVVVDTNRPDQVESASLLLSCTRIAIIDHHRRAADYIDTAVFNFHEPYASSASELVTEMMQYLVDRSDILRVEAEALLAGIVLDTKSFSINTGSGTFEAAAYLKRIGASAEAVKRLLQSDFDIVSARYDLVRSAEIIKGVIALAVSENRQCRISIAQAADELLQIKGVVAAFAVGQDEGTVYVSGRSIGDINVQVVLEKLGGGGSQSTAGLQTDSKSVETVTAELRQAINEHMKKHTPAVWKRN